jgi:hypothetical protein
MRRAIKVKAFFWAWGIVVGTAAKWIGIFLAIFGPIVGSGYLVWRFFGPIGCFVAAIILLFLGITALVARAIFYDDTKNALAERERQKDSAQYVEM